MFKVSLIFKEGVTFVSQKPKQGQFRNLNNMVRAGCHNSPKIQCNLLRIEAID